MDYKKIIAESLKTERKKRKLKQKDLADHLGVSTSAVSMWERGDNSMYVETFIQICEYFDVSLDGFVGKAPKGFDADETEIIRKYRTFDDHAKSGIRAQIEHEYQYIKKTDAHVFAS